MSIEAAAILALAISPGAGRVTVNRLIAWAAATGRSLSDLIHLTEHELYEVVPGELSRSADALMRCTEGNLRRAAALIEGVEKSDGQVISITDGDYPERLIVSLGEAAPPLLFVAGNIDLLHVENAGIVGTRRPSDTGVRLAQQCARTFSQAEIPVLSGGAYGVDMAAHQAALEAEGRTVVVLPQGLLMYRGPREILHAMNEGRGLLISEFAPDAEWSTPGALTRNETIAALSRMMCVIEPGETGGSVRTARHALDQGKCVIVHGRTGDDPAVKRLERAGARRLLGDDGRFTDNRILDAWASEPQVQARQSEMF